MYHRSRDNIAPQDEQNMRLLRQRYNTRALTWGPVHLPWAKQLAHPPGMCPSTKAGDHRSTWVLPTRLFNMSTEIGDKWPPHSMPPHTVLCDKYACTQPS